MVLTRCCVVSVALVVFACDNSNNDIATGRTSSKDRDASAAESNGDDSVSSGALDAGASATASSESSPGVVPGSQQGSSRDAGDRVETHATEGPPSDASAQANAPENVESSSSSDSEEPSDTGTEPPPTSTQQPTTGPDGGAGLVCPDHCPRLPVCVPCNDGSCAEPSFVCLDDGSCSSTVTWTCASGETPEDVPEIAPPAADPEHPCAGLACGDACNTCPAGMLCLVGPGWCDLTDACVQVAPECTEQPPPEGDQVCTVASECPDGPCVTCENDAEWCPEPVCHESVCTLTPNLCPESYEPCAGKQDGDACLLCSPLDPACEEPGPNYECKSGTCQSAR